MVFQDYGRSLYPWLSVARNVELPLKVRGVPKAERAERVAEVLTSVGLADAGRSYPWQLSGGMQQRVAIARSLAYRPDLLLMDEPFASVDAQTRFELEDLEELRPGTVLALGRIEVVGRGPAAGLEQPAAWLIRVRDGQLARMQLFAGQDEARAAAAGDAH